MSETAVETEGQAALEAAEPHPDPPAEAADPPPAESNGEAAHPAPAPEPEAEAPEAKILRRIAAKNDEARERKIEYLHAAEHAKDLKKRWEASVDELQSLIARSKEHHPLFDGPKAEAAPAPAPAAEPDDWRKVELSALDGISQGVLLALAEKDIRTIGDLSEFTDRGGHLVDIEGIGEAKAGAIQDALERYWESRAAADPDAEIAAGVREAERARGEFDDSWRTRDLSDLGLPDAIVGALNGHGIPHVGGLCSYMAQGRELQAVEGVGPAEALEIGDALRRFRQSLSNPQIADYDRVMRRVDLDDEPEADPMPKKRGRGRPRKDGA